MKYLRLLVIGIIIGVGIKSCNVRAAITFSGSWSASSVSTTWLNYSINIPATSSRYLIVSVVTNGTLNFPEANNSVFFNSFPLTMRMKGVQGAMKVYYFDLVNPATGPAQIDILLDNPSGKVLSIAQCWSGVSQSNPSDYMTVNPPPVIPFIGTNVAASNTALSKASGGSWVWANNGEVVVDFIGVNSAPLTGAGIGQTLRGSMQFTYGMASSSEPATATGDILMDWSYNGSRSYVHVAAAIKPDSPLPINLKEFKANTLDDNVIVSWITASEVNNDYFTVQKTTDFEKFETFTLKGSGTTNDETSYSVMDNAPAAVTYYRLVQTDYDGRSEVFYWIAVKGKPKVKDNALNYNILGQILK